MLAFSWYCRPFWRIGERRGRACAYSRGGNRITRPAPAWFTQVNASGQTWNESLKGVEVYDDDVIRTLDNAIYQKAHSPCSGATWRQTAA